MTDAFEERITLETKDLSKRFDQKTIFNKLNLKIRYGKSIGIMGPSGTGKSVLLKCILGLMDYDGEILYKGKVLVKRNRKKVFDSFGMLFQGGALFDSLTIWQNIAFKLLNNEKKISKKDALKTVIGLLHSVGLNENVCNLMPEELSGGMQKRVALARAIADKPSLLFFDEPTTGLDPSTSFSINQLISSIVKKEGITSLVISHDPESIRKICDEVIFIENGSIGWQGSVSEMEKSNHKLLEDYLSPKKIT